MWFKKQFIILAHINCPSSSEWLMWRIPGFYNQNPLNIPSLNLNFRTSCKSVYPFYLVAGMEFNVYSFEWWCSLLRWYDTEFNSISVLYSLEMSHWKNIVISKCFCMLPFCWNTHTIDIMCEIMPIWLSDCSRPVVLNSNIWPRVWKWRIIQNNVIMDLFEVALS